MDQATLARPAAQSGTVRVLSARELPLFRDHLLRLDRDSRHDRFNGALDDDFLAIYAARCVSDGTIIIAYFENGVVRGAAELHQPDLSPGSLPEIAFSVEMAVRRQGVGTMLFTKLIEKARSLGYPTLRITTGAQNDAMRALARRFGARLTFRHGESSGNIDITPMPDARPKTSVLEVARAMSDYNRACWRLWFSVAGLRKPS
ncbi:GNAT family N-acetyltransferase [Tardiphaga sp. vice352]|uniref:GNAT family N-acetyltransferase n=1 Tax=unclassified Tardiphaga TaxID=2631404 RepID=UPI0011657CA6|nr:MULTISPECIES: GNAT family N-acetyltransferase [unclassified Tardiphaga]MBC7585048.1 GNAT family N-acetyltransferase [Tardiphaga sp.]QDM17061.1 GNAT family N-acetyltransferase [Tardiphaga sp. vice278]QDM22043.1 GNAT family N-acetyltransferase [Tardiphaga sp. vice154]QDM27296.1 GNAT family N-acetyltransferase [Tardiphaga sp. vice304]QDM32421.1 GNAT family N-acetyltransferase [Tardiphaga sp. vice352]